METKTEKEIAILFGMSLNGEDGTVSLKELERLAETANVEVVGTLFQRAKEITPATFIGSGKVVELKELVEQTGANLAICDNELSGSQINNISNEIGIKVVDRTTLILDIFAKRALSNEGKLQVELAMLKYYLPRLSGISGTSGRFGSGGVGMRGPGETKLELDKRKVRDQIQKLETQIKKFKDERELRRKNRNASSVKRVSIVGYTNAGKSTLMNLITKAGIYADDKLFATLDTTTRLLWLAHGKQIVLTDTVGFISNLPPAFEPAFSATLEEVLESDLILHLIDITDNHHGMQEEIVKAELKKIGASEIPVLKIYNKIDKLEKSELEKIQETEKDALYISAKKGENIELLKEKIMETLWKE